MFASSRFFLLASALMMAAPLAAQQASFDSTSQGIATTVMVAPAPVVASAPAALVGPVLQTAAVGPRAQLATTAAPAMSMAQNGESSQNLALMVVGGAGLIVGAIIGGRSGTIVMVGSGIIGLVGLFRYVQ
ncbi:MAG TPA: hypothetical protein VIJ16_06690 [Gemmatimonadaceae bacterium]